MTVEMRHNHRAEGRGSVSPSLRTAFTLIELMVVVGIIGLLVAIVVPAISTARDQARATVTQATIGVLETGLEMYRAETRLDGDYPPSVYTSPAFFRPFNPHSAAPPRIPVCGANLLVWGLAGADLLGTPGFRDLDRAKFPPDPFGGWLSDTHAGDGGLYEIKATGQPVISRSGPFVDVSKTKMSNYVGGQGFVIPTARNADINTHPGVLSSYCFLDAFDQPILYYKANPGAPFMVDAGNALLSDGDYGKYNVDGSNPQSMRYIPTGVYNLLDNAPITGIVSNAGSSVVQGMDFGAGQVSTAAYHWLANLGAQGNGSGAFEYQGISGSFAHTVRNPNIVTLRQDGTVVGMRDTGTGVFRPHNADKFILLSAGKDGIFGTGDDIANFPINKD